MARVRKQFPIAGRNGGSLGERVEFRQIQQAESVSIDDTSGIVAAASVRNPIPLQLRANGTQKNKTRRFRRDSRTS